MKTIILILTVIILTQSGLLSLGDNCPEQYVPDINKICIRPNYIQGCQTYKNIDQCSACARDYELEKGKCFSTSGSDLTSNGLIGCLVDNGNTCSNCANGFIKVERLCQKGVKYCSEYDSSNKCLRCQNEYSLIFGQCKHNLMLGCKLEQSDHTCLQCFKPYELKNYQCIIPNCKSYNDYGCISCECGFHITQTHSCQPMQSGCMKYFRGNCVECLDHYRLKGGVCAIQGCIDLSQGLCTICRQNYNLQNGICKFKNCSDWKDDTCLICNEGFSLVEGKCVENKVKYLCSG